MKQGPDGAVEAAALFEAILERAKLWTEQGRPKPRWVGVRAKPGALPLWSRTGGPAAPPARA